MPAPKRFESAMLSLNNRQQLATELTLESIVCTDGFFDSVVYGIVVPLHVVGFAKNFG
jgi:hypothetical protein